MKLRWAILFTALTVFLTACPAPTDPEALAVSLVASPTSLTTAGKVVLTATVTGGPADQVEFFNGTTRVGAPDTTEPYSVEIASLAQTATFKAVATKGGVTAESANVPVTVGGAQTGVTVALSANPSTLTVAGPVVLTAAITGPDAAKVKSVVFTTKTGTAVSTDTTPADGFKANIASVAATTDYVATAKDGNTTLGTGETKVTFGSSGTAIPTGATIADTLAKILAAPATGPGATIAVTADIVCTGDPCIKLLPGQKLLGATATNLLTTPTRKITTNGAGARVVEMANDTEVAGFDFDGTGIYNAVDAPAAVTGSVTVRNVKISQPTINNAVNLKSLGALTINGLEFTTTRQVFIQDFSGATITGLKVTINRDAAATGAALNIQTDAASSTLVVDGLNLTTNLGSGGTAAGNKIGVLFQNSADTTTGGNMTVTVKNSAVTFAPPGAGVDLPNAVAFSFNKVGAGTYTVVAADSTGNSTNSTFITPSLDNRAIYGTGVNGRIAFVTAP